MSVKILKHTELKVYQRAFETAMQIFKLSKTLPKEEKYSLIDQMRRSSRSVCANLAEAWRKRRYPNSFVSKLNDSESEAAETQTWIQFAVSCNYVKRDEAATLYKHYDEIIAMLVKMISDADNWTLSRP